MTLKVSFPNNSGGIGPLLSLDGAASTGEGTRFVTDSPMSRWGLQVVSGSCNASVTLGLSVATSSDATLTTVVTWAASSNGTGDASGDTIWSTDPAPASAFAAVLASNGSSGGTSAWVVGAP